ncbi:MAG: hypothetical protein E7040_04805 [Lentisphaerae bacterium]|nr:hypothetical protein [Lentisphaerota bacterium]
MKKMFSLHELVVVVVLSAIGIAALTAIGNENPANKAEVKLCADNMKKISMASHQYAADNNDYLPGTANRVGLNWQMLIAPYLGYGKPKAGWYPDKYPIYKCPSDKTVPAKWVTVNAHIAKVSYCSNASVIDDFWGDVNTDRSRGGRKLSTIGQKDKTIMFAELHHKDNVLRYGSATKCYQPGYMYEYTVQRGTVENDDGKVGYHDYKNNWAMVDGHIEFKNYEETLKPFNYWTYKKP